MYRQGHYGVALLVWAPVGGVIALAGSPEISLLGLVVVLAVEQLPDYDMRTTLIKHRGITHTLVFSVAVGALVGAIGFAVGQAGLVEQFLSASGLEESALSLSPVTIGLVGFGFGVLGIVSHFVGDVITPSGVPLLWPVSSKSYTLDLVLAKNTVANYLLLAAGIVASYFVIDLTTRFGPLF